ncbi:MAG: thioredoxin family protein [Euryarchaeota archaeon]|nr:thioredoxin family protein [Euryarchaeota archaeon]MBT3653917.1 thioredoxin family protein [Euryarchaeota archaeon]MBT3757321.1 thioredoxin family protein [Euryarchaeota archaeon]MBT4050134.1 thioredoxin family protein [Euryarchaeota archaeon]MBT4346867.1 thioredoxin family protein [Euryarchaeota archaeon]
MRMMILQVFTHPACSSCGPVVESAWEITENNEHIKIQTVRLEDKQGLATAQSLGIRTIPSIIVKIDDDEVHRLVGTPKPGELESVVMTVTENMR